MQLVYDSSSVVEAVVTDVNKRDREVATDGTRCSTGEQLCDLMFGKDRGTQRKELFGNKMWREMREREIRC